MLISHTEKGWHIHSYEYWERNHKQQTRKMLVLTVFGKTSKSLNPWNMDDTKTSSKSKDWNHLCSLWFASMSGLEGDFNETNWKQSVQLHDSSAKPFCLTSLEVQHPGFSWKKNTHHAVTPRKTYTEPKNHPIEKENHFPKPSFSGSMLIFQGVVLATQLPVLASRKNGICTAPSCCRGNDSCAPNFSRKLTAIQEHRRGAPGGRPGQLKLRVWFRNLQKTG